MSRWARRWITTGRWLSRVTWARSSSNSAVFPTWRARRVFSSVRSAWPSAASAIATRRSLRTASKYACVTSSLSCASCEVSSTSALRRPAAAIRFCAVSRPPVKRFCESERPRFQVFARPNGRLPRLAKGFAFWAHSTALSRESTRSEIGSVGSGLKRRHSSAGGSSAPAESSGASAENCDLIARV